MLESKPKEERPPLLEEIEIQKDPRAFKRLIVITVPILFVVSMLYGLVTGSISIPLQEVWTALFYQSNTTEGQIIWDLRLPRILTGALVGACLAIAGALLQGVMRNPLADPGIIGVSAGAGLVAVVMMIVLPQYIQFLPLGAFLGALLTTFVIYFVAWKGGVSPLRMILAGVAINSLLGAVMSAIMILYSDRVQAVLPWLVGGLGGRSWPHFSIIWPYALIGMVLSVFAIKHANILLLGDDVAKLLGNQVEKSRAFLILLATFLAGAAVSVAGLIGFVGLVVPHIVRLIVGNDYRFLLPISAIGGAFIVVLADTAARSWFEPIELPVGILLALLGAPFFLYLLRGGMKSWKMS
ncbi:iron complex transport system permease protein [Bacillus mesophilus]|uniref:Iron ABC transporter permease n=1 Tax=Bacillus mesophilus TaxID=1808955 RepID=A0A6M0QB50_9BACI|nr:iron ABC transporter permease [Bacillus mesophilus]MBM7661857.1 iron complex transport system permease protein [Bacillus mesophilus]NEY72780.1 iron ABC transporter permease [Bacillus mesophilus]